VTTTLHTAASVTIDRPATEVWAVVADYATDTRWRKGITEFSRRSNVTAKISGVIAYGDLENWSVESLRPYVEHTIGSFGWDRVVWGSDWPVCTLGGGLAPWVAATHALTSGCSPEERDKLYQANAKRIWSI